MKRFFFIFIFIHLASSSVSQDKKHHYKSGEVFPDITFVPVNGDPVTTSLLKGKKFLLMFNRYVSCPLCNFRAHEIMQLYDSVENNQFVILSVYESGNELLETYTKQEKIPFMMIPDPEEKLYKQFKIKKSWWRAFIGLFNNYNEKHSKGKEQFSTDYDRDGSLNRIGADFLVNEKGIIDVAYYGKFAGDHLSIDVIRKWILQD